MPESEEVKEILQVVSTEIPALIRGVISSIFSEEAGRDMGRAAAAFYKELKEGGMPEDVAVKMTENYIGVFTSLGDLLKEVGRKGEKGKLHFSTNSKSAEKIEEAIAKQIEEKLAEKLAEKRKEA